MNVSSRAAAGPPTFGPGSSRRTAARSAGSSAGSGEPRCSGSAAPFRGPVPPPMVAALASVPAFSGGNGVAEDGVARHCQTPVPITGTAQRSRRSSRRHLRHSHGFLARRPSRRRKVLARIPQRARLMVRSKVGDLRQRMDSAAQLRQGCHAVAERTKVVQLGCRTVGAPSSTTSLCRSARGCFTAPPRWPFRRDILQRLQPAPAFVRHGRARRGDLRAKQ